MKRHIALSILAIVATESSASVIDQDILYTKSDQNAWSSSRFGRITWITQSFTAGISGSFDRIDLQINRFGADDLRVRLGTGEAFDGSFVEFFAADIANANLPNVRGSVFSLDLSGNGLSVVSGSRYSIILSAITAARTNGFEWVIGETTPDGVELFNAPYAGGQAHSSRDLGASWEVRGVDRPLRTWVTAPVPEPASWALMIAGFGLVGAAARRQSFASV